MRRRGTWFAAIVIAGCSGWGAAAIAHPFCAPNFAYGNAGYAAGYSIAGARGWGAGCGPRWGGRFCGPSWGGWNSVGGWPDACGGGWGFGWPRFGFGGWCGARRWACRDSVFLSVPAYGNATFFSGCVTPFVTGCGPVFSGWPANWYPGYAVGPCGWYPYAVPAPVGVGPQFGPAGILPFLGASTGVAPAVGAVAAVNTAPRVVAARPRPAVRLVNDAARRRAERLVALGDRHLRAAEDGAPVRVRAALDAYRRAATAVPDDPDIRVREALALVALGEVNASDTALARAAAIDGRLAAAPPRRGDLPPDPVFGDRPADGMSPLAARGSAILREIGGAEAADVAWLAARWGIRWGAGAAAVASR